MRRVMRRGRGLLACESRAVLVMVLVVTELVCVERRDRGGREVRWTAGKAQSINAGRTMSDDSASELTFVL